MTGNGDEHETEEQVGDCVRSLRHGPYEITWIELIERDILSAFLENIDNYCMKLATLLLYAKN